MRLVIRVLLLHVTDEGFCPLIITEEETSCKLHECLVRRVLRRHDVVLRDITIAFIVRSILSYQYAL